MKENQHRHGHREILVVIEGHHFYGVDGRLLRMEPGTIVFFEPGKPHDQNYSPYHPPCRNLWLCFSSQRTALTAEVVVRKRPGRHNGSEATYQTRRVLTGPFVEAALESWKQYEKEPDTPSRMEQLKAATTALLYHTEDRYREALPHDGPDPSPVIAQIREHIHQHPGDDLSLASLARLSGYAPNYFHRMFRTQTGEPLHRFVRNIRLERAKTLLGEGYSVQTVAESLGFATPAYFSRFFKQATGKPPVLWKQTGNSVATGI